MQTFLPFDSYTKSAAVLDNKRLNKQRIELIQIVNALTLPSYGWKNHPAVKMWEGAIPSLMDYWEAIELQCRARGFKPRPVPEHLWFEHTGHVPSWVGNEEFHLSHRLNLLFKDPAWYSTKFNEPVPLTKPEYYWPTKQGKV